MRIVIVGAGGHGQVVADILRECLRAGLGQIPVGFVDDNPQTHGQRRLDLPVYGAVGSLVEVPHDAVVIAVGSNTARRQLWHLLNPAEAFATVTHPAAIVSQDVVIGDGSMLCAGAIVNTGSRIGRGVILNTGCTVDHHTAIGDFVHIAPGVHMGGEVRVGDGAFVGIGAVVLPKVSIGKGSTVGAGAVVTEDVAPGLTVVGCPARPMPRSMVRTA